MKCTITIFALFTLILAGMVTFWIQTKSIQGAESIAITELDKGNWYHETKSSLESLIATNAGKRRKVIFDFDNTIICRDIGEATFTALVRDKRLTLHNAPLDISPAFELNGNLVDLGSAEDPMDYYQSFLTATNHHSNEKTPYSNGYAWIVQIMKGVSPQEIINYTEKAFPQDGFNESQKLRGIDDDLQKPFFYSEMIDLIGVLLKNDYEVFVISASNVWAVRWIVLKKLNPLIQVKHGREYAIPPEHVLGISVLLRDKRTNKLSKDPYLIRENAEYRNMEPNELEKYVLTTQIVYPLTAYFGKLANIFKYISDERPFLIVGDSPNDFPMLNWAENRLWITRLEKMDYQRNALQFIRDALIGKWLLQPVLYKEAPGFVSSLAELKIRLGSKPSQEE